MRFKVMCLSPGCDCTIWVRGTDEPDVNAVSLDENDDAWSDEDTCEHIKAGGNYDIGEAEYDDDYDPADYGY